AANASSTAVAYWVMRPRLTIAPTRLRWAEARAYGLVTVRVARSAARNAAALRSSTSSSWMVVTAAASSPHRSSHLTGNVASVSTEDLVVPPGGFGDAGRSVSIIRCPVRG